MKKKITFNTLLFLGIFTELLIFLFSYLYKENFGDISTLLNPEIVKQILIKSY